ncbi:hypothetical protein [Vreelandella sulfidaeris]|uniref:hypothetical protein n=1 Tax=Vreelandella sulfidaeris TaxID=115553 RepID=UPI0035EA9CA0
MKKTTIIACFTTVSLLAGCASSATPTGDRHYSKNNSHAYNLVRAGGLNEARDTQLADEEYSYMMSNMAGGASTALSLSNSSGFGLSGGASLGIGIASALLSGPGMMGRDSAFAFVPETEASSSTDATQVIRKRFLEAAKVAAEDNEFELEVIDKILDLRLDRYRNMMVLGLTNEAIGCMAEANATNPDEVCSISLYYPEKGSTLRETPTVAKDAAGEQSYQYFAADSRYALRTVAKLSNELNARLGEQEAETFRLALLTSLSSAMPDWFYIYESGKEHLPPMVLANGEMEFFVTRQ